MQPVFGKSSTKKRAKRSKRGPEPIATVLLRASGSESRHGAPLPPRAWHDAVGDRIARRTRPMRLERGVLTVRAATAVWAQELTFVAPTILQRLNALGFEVEALRFRVGPIEGADRPLRAARLASVAPLHALPTGLTRELAHVGDSNLRDAIARAAAANLAWQAAARPTTSGPPAAPSPRSSARETDPPGRKPTTGRGAGRHKS